MASHSIDFNRLAVSARQRLAQLLTNPSDPVVVYATPGNRDAAIFKGVVAGLGVLGSLALMLTVLVEFQHDSTGREQLAIFLGIVLFFTFLALLSLLWRLIWKPPPWKWNVYFATGARLVHVQRSRVVFADTDDLGRPRIVHRYRNGAYMGSTIAFPNALTLPFTSESATMDFLDRLSQARAVYQRARQAGDTNTLRAIDPFWEGAQRGAYEEPAGAARGEPTVTTIPGAVRAAGWFAALVLAGVVAGAFYFVVELILGTI